MWPADGWTCALRTHTGTYLDWFCQPIFIKRCRGIFSCYASLLWNGGALKCLTALSSLLRPPHLLPPTSPSLTPLSSSRHPTHLAGLSCSAVFPLLPSAEGTQPRLGGVGGAAPHRLAFCCVGPRDANKSPSRQSAVPRRHWPELSGASANQKRSRRRPLGVWA